MLTVADAYCAAARRSHSWISLQIFGSGKRLRELRAGADAASGRVEDALQWFSDRWPADEPWPQGIDRPPAKAPSAASATD